LAADDNASGVRCQLASNDAEQRRLTGAARTEHAEDAPGLHLDVDAA
jgi:hypothetical protein